MLVKWECDNVEDDCLLNAEKLICPILFGAGSDTVNAAMRTETGDGPKKR